MRFGFESICLICVAILAAGEEHSHLNDSTSEALVHTDKHDHHDHDDHVDHDHSDHDHDAHDQEHTNHKIPYSPDPEEVSGASDYVTWLAATGNTFPTTSTGLLVTICLHRCNSGDISVWSLWYPGGSHHAEGALPTPDTVPDRPGSRNTHRRRAPAFTSACFSRKDE